MVYSRVIVSTVLGLSLLSASSAWALKAGDNFVAVGAAYVSPNISADSLSYAGNVYLPHHTLPGPLPIMSASASGTTTAALILGHMYTDNLGLVLDIGIPPKTNISMSQAILTKGTSQDIGSVKLWSPMLVGRYYFLDAASAFRPYLGAGVTYTAFKSLALNSVGQGLAPNGASIDSAWGWVVSGGFNYDIKDTNYFLTGSLTYIDTKTTMHVNNLVDPAPVGPASTTNLKLGNTISFLGVGYRF
ncbi:MAG: OmpW family protein [Ferrovum sp.]|nr:OmpW family protein [Ferrovum sp.]